MIYDDRPQLKIPKSPVEKFLDVLSVLFLVGTFVYVAMIWADLPDKVPAHFNAKGEADRWGGKGSILILPIVGTLLFKTVFLLGKFPHISNYPVKITEENAERQYRNMRQMLSTMNAGLAFFFAAGTWHSAQTALGNPGLGAWLVPLLLISTFGTIGIYLCRSFNLK